MKTIAELREEFDTNERALDAIETAIDAADEPTEEQRKNYEALLEKRDNLADQIKFAETRENERKRKAEEAAKRKAAETAAARAAGAPVVDGEAREYGELAAKYSFQRAFAPVFGGKLEGLEAEMSQQGKEDMRAIGEGATGVVIPHGILHARANVVEGGNTGVIEASFVQSVYASTILGRLGVTEVTTATDYRIPIIGAATTQWEGETDAAADGGAVTTKKDLTPTRAATYINYSKQAALQHNSSLEQALREAIRRSLAAKVEYAVLTDDTANGASANIQSSLTAGSSSTMVGCALAAIEEVLGNNHNEGNLGFAVSSSLFSEAHSAVQVTGVSPLMVNNQIMGMPTEFSTQIEDAATNNEAILYGDWSKVWMAQFGGIEIILDNLTEAVSGMNKLVLNSYWDHALVQAGALSLQGFSGTNI